MDNLKKLQQLFKNLFQFEASDLDFGIYRILNYKRDQTDRFIKENLKKQSRSSICKT